MEEPFVSLKTKNLFNTYKHLTLFFIKPLLNFNSSSAVSLITQASLSVRVCVSTCLVTSYCADLCYISCSLFIMNIQSVLMYIIGVSPLSFVIMWFRRSVEETVIVPSENPVFWLKSL